MRDNVPDVRWWVETVCGRSLEQVREEMPEIYRRGRPSDERRRRRAELEACFAEIIATGQVGEAELANALGIWPERIYEALRRDARRCAMEHVVALGAA